MLKVKQKYLWRWILICLSGFSLYMYMANFSPYKEDGSLEAPVIMTMFILVALFCFLILQSVGLLLMQPTTANKLAILGSAIITQVLLINSGSLLSFGSILIIIGFNILIFWYMIAFYTNKSK